MMKNLLKYAAIAALSLAACTKVSEEGTYNPDTTLYREGEVTLLASIEDFATKAYMPSSGYGMWKAGDEIAVRMNDGSYVTFALSGTGDTKRAFFKGEVPEGKTLGDCAVYPASAIKSVSGDKVTANIPSELSDESFDGIMVAKIEDSWEVTFRQTLSGVLLSLSNFPTAATTFAVKEEGRSLCGDFSFDPLEAYVTGVSAPIGDGILHYTLPKAAAKLNVNIYLPVADYKNLSIIVYNEDGRAVDEQSLLSATFTAERSALKTISKTLDDVNMVSDYISLMGVTWCKGNLQRNASASQDGWQAGWELAESQWFTYNYDLKSNGKYTYNEAAASEMRFDIDKDHCNHFNFGGIADPYTKDSESYAAPSGDKSISGKMFTDRACTVSTSDFGQAKYGDLAYWASMGQYRMPTLEEISTLKSCDCSYGHYLTSDGMKVWGLLFTEPANPSSPASDNTDKRFTDEQLESGLFLPAAGRRADSSTTVIQYRVQGLYWTGGAVDKSSFFSEMGWTAGSGDEYQYSDYLYFKSTSRVYGHTQGYAFDRMAGFCIRPVLN